MLKKVLVFLVFVLPLHTWSQTVLTGNVFDNDTRSLAIEGATIKNLTSKSVVLTNKDGHFAIPANKGDLISYGMVGYELDTIYLINLFPKNIYLRVAINSLDAVNITTTKVSPFLNTKDPEAVSERELGYSKYRGGLRLGLGYGKLRRQQDKLYDLEEEDGYQEEIAKHFTKEIIEKLVNYRAADLKDYMDLYRPSTSDVRAERPFNYTYYIATTFQEWKKLPAEARKLPSLYQPKTNSAPAAEKP